MEITVADERAWLLKEQLTMDQAEGRAWSKKADAFGTIAKVSRFLQRPKDEEFELIYKEHRYEPFWHIAYHTLYIYERARPFTITVGGPMVGKVTLNEVDFIPEAGQIKLIGIEHCREEQQEDVLIEGVTGDRRAELSNFLSYEKVEIPEDDLDEFAPQGTVVVPPKANASTVVHSILVTAIKSVEADKIIEDRVTLEKVDLYYRPVYAFQYRWGPKDKAAILEYDGLTGQMRPGGQVFRQYVGKMLDPQFLFDIGVDTVDLLVPGGGIAIKLAQKGLNAAKSKRG